MSDTALPSFTSARAILIGTAAYSSQDLEDIPHSLRNIRGLTDVLTDAVLSGFVQEHVTLVADPRKPEDIMQPVTTAAAEAKDVLLVYYSGHGLLAGDNSNLHLSLTGSEPDKPWTSLQFSYLASAVKDASAATKILILDCCYSGRAHSDLMDGETQTVQAQLAVEGLYCLTSAPQTKRSKAPKGEKYTAFTGYLLAAMQGGIAGAGPVLRMSDLYGEVRSRMRATTLPLPEQCNKKDAGSFPLVRNSAYSPVGVELPSPELDFSRSRAVVIGSGTYENEQLNPLPSSLNDAREIHETLLNTEIFGFKPDHCVLVTDPAAPSEMLLPLEDAAEEAEDVLFIYYSGHSLISDGGSLNLSTRATRIDRLASTTLSASLIAQVVAQSRAREHVIIADACFAARLADCFASVPDCYILGATGRTQRAMTDRENSLFTKGLLKTLRSGIPGAASHLTLIDVFLDMLRSNDNSLPSPRLSLSQISHPRCLLRNHSESANFSAPHACLMTA
ncbi:caspase domain-containing protein [Streptomyces adustus]|uniref:caspase family protein n=1 Tax=Streptomyces adustus TaxID=1609272 RepID=UPI0035DD4F03